MVNRILPNSSIQTHDYTMSHIVCNDTMYGEELFIFQRSSGLLVNLH